MSDALPTIAVAPMSFRLASGGETNITITNTEALPVSYKVKTTTPTRYIVRPRIGVLPPKGSVSINITHRPAAKTETPANLTLLRDRFKVEAVYFPAGTADTEENLSKLWQAKPKAKEAEVHCEVVLTESAPAASGASPNVTSNASVLEATPSSISRSSGVTLPSETSVPRQEVDQRIQRFKETEDKHRQQIAQLESELKEARSKLQDALVAGKAKERELQSLQAKGPKGGVSIALLVPIMILMFILSYMMRSTKE